MRLRQIGGGGATQLTTVAAGAALSPLLFDGTTGLPLVITQNPQAASTVIFIRQERQFTFFLDIINFQTATLTPSIDIGIPANPFSGITANEIFNYIVGRIGVLIEPMSAVMAGPAFPFIEIARVNAAVLGTLTANAYASVNFPVATNITFFGQITGFLP